MRRPTCRQPSRRDRGHRAPRPSCAARGGRDRASMVAGRSAGAISRLARPALAAQPPLQVVVTICLYSSSPSETRSASRARLTWLRAEGAAIPRIAVLLDIAGTRTSAGVPAAVRRPPRCPSGPPRRGLQRHSPGRPADALRQSARRRRTSDGGRGRRGMPTRSAARPPLAAARSTAGAGSPARRHRLSSGSRPSSTVPRSPRPPEP